MIKIFPISYIIFFYFYRRIIKNAGESGKEERQNMFDQLNATRIFITLIWDEKIDSTAYYY